MSIRRPHVTLASLAVIALSTLAMLYLSPFEQSSANEGFMPIKADALEPILPTPAPLKFKPLTKSESMAANAAIPLAMSPLEVAHPFALKSLGSSPFAQPATVDCLTAAVYYEAGYEPLQGKRAVAQTILNRVRHRAFPKSVCGVIYEGSKRKTGCQFTFTCDGSLARKPPHGAWAQARAVAEAALGGFVEPSVGMATHYHANYVVPYWAESLDKISQVGAHLFYKWRGSWGRRDAFTQVPQLEGETGVPQSTPMIEYVFDSDVLTARSRSLPEGPSSTLRRKSWTPLPNCKRKQVPRCIFEPTTT